MSYENLFSAQIQFHLQEVDDLREEMSELVKHTRSLEIYAIDAMAAFYAWYIKEKPPTMTLLIPLVLAFMGGFRSYAALYRIDEISCYLRGLEQVLAMKRRGLVGWESHRKRCARASSTGFFRITVPFVISAAAFWILLIAISGGFCYYTGVFEGLPRSAFPRPTIYADNIGLRIVDRTKGGVPGAHTDWPRYWSISR